MNSLTLRPMIILVDDATIKKFGPTIAALADDLDKIIEASVPLSAVMASNGWTVEMIAWGKFLSALADRYSVTLIDRRDEGD